MFAINATYNIGLYLRLARRLQYKLRTRARLGEEHAKSLAEIISTCLTGIPVASRPTSSEIITHSYSGYDSVGQEPDYQWHAQEWHPQALSEASVTVGQLLAPQTAVAAMKEALKDPPTLCRQICSAIVEAADLVYLRYKQPPGVLAYLIAELQAAVAASCAMWQPSLDHGWLELFGCVSFAVSRAACVMVGIDRCVWAAHKLSSLSSDPDAPVSTWSSETPVRVAKPGHLRALFSSDPPLLVPEAVSDACAMLGYQAWRHKKLILAASPNDLVDGVTCICSGTREGQ
ncbi:hypothetical protein GGI12_001423 [Dipsacomyces acuminosporus]|nr:hypothetical protein GGI12_001423 [Dipsacomyces acuminosporus]